MRVTTRMVNDAALKAGVPTNANSLLDYVKGTKSGNDLLSALKSSKSEKSKTSQNEYEKLEKAAGQLMQKAEAFAEQGRNLYLPGQKRAETWKIFIKMQRHWLRAIMICWTTCIPLPIH